MVFEHFAVNVADRAKAEAWYIEHLGLTVVRSIPGNMAFLADDTGRVIIELYQKGEAEVLPFSEMHPLTFHIAFSVEELQVDVARLEAAGATVLQGPETVRGDEMAMMRDPFGVAIQLVQRKEPMV